MILRKGLLLLLLAGAGACASRPTAHPAAPVSAQAAGKPAAIPPAALPDPKVERFQVPLAGNEPIVGPPDAKVTIVVFSDFQCPFCARASDTMNQLLRTYGPNLRIVWENFPLDFHANAKPAAKVALVAHETGKFWDLHARLFENQRALDRESLVGLARELGLDAARVNKALDEDVFDARIAAEMARGQALGVRGTPAFFINGRPISGAQPLEKFTAVVDEELVLADRAIAAGVARTDVYRVLTSAGKTKADPEGERARHGPDPDKVYQVPIGSSPARGAADALVTVVEFGDFACPFTRRAEATLAELRKRYGNQLRIVWKDFPLPFHEAARPQARAARAALEQGKFWQMHDRILAEPVARPDPDWAALAKTVGITGDLPDAPSIDADVKQAEALELASTPTFIINGRRIEGALPLDEFIAIIDKELAGKPKVDENGDPIERITVKLSGKEPSRGPKTAKVTIVEFSDFQCPYCAKAATVMDALVAHYRNKIRLVWKNLPLEFHPHARPAAKLALAAHAKGKFWKMHDALFEALHGSKYQQDFLLATAREISLDVPKYGQSLAGGRGEAAIQEDEQLAQKLGVDGTPVFFINGHVLTGAQPVEAFTKLIDAEIAALNAASKKARAPRAAP